MDLGKLSKINNDLAREMAAVPISRGKPGLFALLLQKIAEICICRAVGAALSPSNGVVIPR